MINSNSNTKIIGDFEFQETEIHLVDFLQLYNICDEALRDFVIQFGRKALLSDIVEFCITAGRNDYLTWLVEASIITKSKKPADLKANANATDENDYQLKLTDKDNSIDVTVSDNSVQKIIGYIKTKMKRNIDDMQPCERWADIELQAENNALAQVLRFISDMQPEKSKENLL